MRLMTTNCFRLPLEHVLLCILAIVIRDVVSLSVCVCVWHIRRHILLRDHSNVYFIAHYFHNSFTHNLKAKYLNSNYIYIKLKTIAISDSPMSLFLSWRRLQSSFDKYFVAFISSRNQFYIIHQFPNDYNF